MLYDKDETDIKDYLEELNFNQNNFLDDYIYSDCKICQKELNAYFCENCYKNLCNNCIQKCKAEKHDFINLVKYLKENSFNFEEIKNLLGTIVIPFKKNINDLNEEELFNNIKKEEKNDDFLLIIEIIWADYINYFHFKNIERILKYIKIMYNKYSNTNYEGYGNIFCILIIIIFVGLKIICQMEKELYLEKMEQSNMRVI